MKLDTFTQAYIVAALWSSTDESRDDGGDPLDNNYSADDLAPDALRAMVEDCVRFQEENADDLRPFDDDDNGHNFWLNRNGHGCGFWDGDYPEPQASRLDAACKAFGEVSLYVGDDGMIYHHEGC